MQKWLMVERERARRLYIRALKVQAQNQAMNGSTSEAISSYELVLEIDGLNEEACRGLMESHFAAGRRTEGLRVFREFERRLCAEFQLTPEAETVELFERIRNSDSPRVAARVSRQVDARLPTSPAMDMVGRDAELKELESLLLQVTKGASISVGIEGEIGIGKTRLVTELCRVASSTGSKAICIRCGEFPQPAPYSVLRSLSTEFPRLLSEIESIPRADGMEASSALRSRPLEPDFGVSNQIRTRFVETITRDLADSTMPGPLVLVLEDVQFSDLASLDLLLCLQNGASNQRLLTVLTWRSGDCPSIVTAFLSSARGLLRVLKLSRLSKMVVGDLCCAFNGGDDATQDLVDFVYQQSEGNPLFAVECLKSLRIQDRNGGSHSSPEGKRVGSAKNEGRYVPGSAPEGIRRYVVGRTDKLPKKVKQLLRFAAAFGREIDPDFLAKLLNQPLARILRGLDVLLAAGLIQTLGDRFEFSHDKVREICYEDIPLSVRFRIHRRLYSFLEIYFADRLEALAFHATRAGRRDRAVTYWERLGDQASELWAHSDAYAAFTESLSGLELLGGAESQSRRFDLLRKRALACEHLGELEKGTIDISKMREIASELADERRYCEARMLESRFLFRRGLLGAALDCSSKGTQLAREVGDIPLEAQCREVAGLALNRLGDFRHSEKELLLIVDLLEPQGRAEDLERIWNSIGRVQITQGRKLEGIESLEKAERYRTGNLQEEAMRALLRGIARMYMGRGEEAALDMELAERNFVSVGNSSGRAIANAFLSFYHACSGDLFSAVICGRKGLPFKAGKADARWAWVSTTVLSCGLWFVLGNYRLAEREIAKSLEANSAKGNPGYVLDTAAAIALELGQVEKALSLSHDSVSQLNDYETPAVADSLVTLGSIYLACGNADKAVGPLRRAAVILENALENLTLPRALSFLSLAELEMGLLGGALDHSKQATEILSQNKDFAFLAQQVYWNRFLVLRASGDPTAIKILSKARKLVLRQASQLGTKGKTRFLSLRVNREILNSWEKIAGEGVPVQPSGYDGWKFPPVGRVSTVSVLIPASGAPWGRQLKPKEYVEVVWTADAGKPDRTVEELKGGVGLRRARILRLCAEANVQGGDPREEDIARVLRVTTRTIRSDIAYLRSQGCYVKTRGANLQ